MFHAFGFSERLLKEACWVNETTFWKPDETQRSNIVRSGRVQDVEDGLSEFPHVVLNQARVHDFYLQVMRNAPNRLEPDYARRVLFDPLGLGPVEWSTDGKGEPRAASGGRMRPTDLLRVGQMVLANGAWQGKQVVPAEWLKRSTTPAVTIEGTRRYGWHWYLSELPAQGSAPAERGPTLSEPSGDSHATDPPPAPAPKSLNTKPRATMPTTV
jgi:hypothetical protein